MSTVDFLRKVNLGMKLRRTAAKQAEQILQSLLLFRIVSKLRLAYNKTGKSSKIDLPRFYFGRLHFTQPLKTA